MLQNKDLAWRKKGNPLVNVVNDDGVFDDLFEMLKEDNSLNESIGREILVGILSAFKGRMGGVEAVFLMASVRRPLSGLVPLIC